MIELFKFYGVFGMADVLDFFAETLKKIDFFELTTFNLNEIKSQESQCEIASYDEE